MSAAILPQHTHSSKPCAAWSQVTSPNVGTSYNTLNGVAAISAHNVWAVGAYGNGNGSFTLVEHWTGTQWQVVASPNVLSVANSLAAISAVSATDMWAVGSVSGTNGIRTLIEHWNGSTWKVVTSPSPGSVVSDLAAAARVPATRSVWAVGYTQDTNSQTFTAFYC